MEGAYQNNIPSLQSLGESRYENIFKLYKTDDNQYYYNIIKAISLGNYEVDDTKVQLLQVKKRAPWTTISFNVYKSIELWWLICIVNKIRNPVLIPAQGTYIKIVKPEYVKQVLDDIKTAII